MAARVARSGLDPFAWNHVFSIAFDMLHLLRRITGGLEERCGGSVVCRYAARGALRSFIDAYYELEDGGCAAVGRFIETVDYVLRVINAIVAKHGADPELRRAIAVLRDLRVKLDAALASACNA